jgi:hypothetical protein
VIADAAYAKGPGIADSVGATVIENSTIAATSTKVVDARKMTVATSTKVVDARRILTVANIRATVGVAFANVTGIADIVGATVIENSTHALSKAGSTGSTSSTEAESSTGLGFRHRSNT